MSVSRGTVHSIQFLRFLAATLVAVFHAQVGFAVPLPWGVTPTENYLFGFGAVGVHIFFVISGYIMYLTNFARSQPFSGARFFMRRLIRIYPTYWIFVGLYLAVGTALAVAPALTPGQLFGALLLWPGHAPRVIGPAWTLSFELFFYFAFGLAMQLGARRGVWALTIGFLVLTVLGVVLHPTSPATAMVTRALLLEFIAGIWIARITSTTALPRFVGWTALGLGVFGFALGIAWGYDRLQGVVMWGLPSALLIIGSVVLEQTAVDGRRAGLIRRLSVLGDSSYSLYLCHILLITLGVQAVVASGVSAPLGVMVVLTTLIAIGAAHAFYLGIERPLVRRLQS